MIGDNEVTSVHVLRYDKSLQVLRIVVFIQRSHVIDDDKSSSNISISCSSSDISVSSSNISSYYIDRHIKYFNHLNRMIRIKKKKIMTTATTSSIDASISLISGIPLKSFQKLMMFDRSWDRSCSVSSSSLDIINELSLSFGNPLCSHESTDMRSIKATSILSSHNDHHHHQQQQRCTDSYQNNNNSSSRSCSNSNSDNNSNNNVKLLLSLKRSIDNVERWLYTVFNGLDRSTLQIELDQHAYLQRRIDIQVRREMELKSRRLQQYFASTSNIDLLMKYVMSGIDQTTDTVNTSSSSSSSSGRSIGSSSSSSNVDSSFNRRRIMEDILFIEPSCGDGRVIHRLLAHGAMNIIGIDIDPDVVKNIRRLVHASGGTKNYRDNNDDHRYHSNSRDDVDHRDDCDKVESSDMTILIQDYLTTSRTSLMASYPTYNNKDIYVVGGPPYTIIKQVEATLASHLDVVAAGTDDDCDDYDDNDADDDNKKYDGDDLHHNDCDRNNYHNVNNSKNYLNKLVSAISTTPVNNNSSELPVASYHHHFHLQHDHDDYHDHHHDHLSIHKSDYPLLFLIHSAIELQAVTVIFILPDRCNTSRFIDRVLYHLNHDNPHHHVWRIQESVQADSSFTLMDR